MIELTGQNAAAYLGTPCTVDVLGGGVSNTVLLASFDGRRIIIKQSLAKLRVEQDWFSRRDRIFRETAALRMLQPLLPPGSVPSVLSEDRDNFAFTMTAAPSSAKTWKALLFEGSIDENVASRVAESIGTIIASTWRSPDFVSTFADQTVFDELRLDPYYRWTARRHPDLAPHFDALIEAASKRRLSLVHGDCSPKNFLVSNEGVMLIDFEVAHFGDPSFDAAFLLNHLLLKSYRLPEYRERLRGCAMRFWQTLCLYIPRECDWFEAATIQHLGGLLLARIDGKSPVEYITDEGLKERIRQHARGLLCSAPSRIAGVFAC